MPAEAWDRLHELFSSAFALPAGKREAFLAEACGDDSELRHEVVELLRHADDSDGSLDGPAVSNVAAVLRHRGEQDRIIGALIGPYRIVKRIGHGGFGDVYLGVRTDGFVQKVAIKLLRQDSILDETLRRRFELERQVLADLNHEGIARLIDGGATSDGRPYLVMEYVKGQSITKYCQAKACDLQQRLELFQQVCRAVAHAHQFGVIHRDIKPANVLVNRQGVTKLVDFGIAKLADLQSLSESLTLTRQGLLPFTPEYASPEQVRGERTSPSTDVYSLGILLFELLTESRPYQFATSSAQEVVEAICETAPPRPSQYLQHRTAGRLRSTTEAEKVTCANGRARGVEKRRLQRKLVGDLDNIVLKALRKESERRYLSAAELSEDVRRYQQGLPVDAAADSVTYRVTKWAKRHRTVFTAAVLVLLSLSIGFITAAVAWNRARGIADRLAQEIYVRDTNSAFESLRTRDFQAARQMVDRLRETPGIDDVRGVEWQLLQSVTHRPPPVKLPAHNGRLTELARVPGQPWVVSVGEDATIQVSDIASGRHVMTLGIADGPLDAVAVSPDGKTVATGSQTVQLWDVETRQLRGVLANCTATVESLAFAPSGTELAVGVRYKDVSIHSLVGQPSIVVQADGPRHERLAFLPGGRSLVFPATKEEEFFLQIWDRSSRRVTQELRSTVTKGFLQHMAISSDGRWIAATSSYESRIYVYDSTTGKSVGGVLLQRTNALRALAFSPDDSLLAGACDDGSVGIWQFIETPRSNHSPTESSVDDRPLSTEIRLEQCDSFRADASRINTLAFVDNQWLVTGGDDGAVKIWSVFSPGLVRLPALDEAGFATASMSADRQVIAGIPIVGLSARDIWWRRLDKDKLWNRISRRPVNLADVAVSPQGDSFAVATVDGLIEMWDVQGLEKVSTVRHCDRLMVGRLCFSPDGRRLASTARDKSTCLWDVATSRLICRWDHPDNALRLAFCPKSERLAIGTCFRELRIMDVQTQRLLRSLVIAGDNHSLAWAPDGRRIAAGQKNGEILIFDLESDDITRLPGDGASTMSLAFSPDGKTLVSGSNYGKICLWHVDTGRPLGVLYELQAAAPGVAVISGLFFSPNQDQLIATTWSAESPVLMWDLK